MNVIFYIKFKIKELLKQSKEGEIIIIVIKKIISKFYHYFNIIGHINRLYLKKKIIFVHVPRTGGTSIKHYFNFYYGRESYNEINDLKPLTIKEFNKKKIFLGHKPYTDLKNKKKLLIFTILRKPEERIISRFFYLKNFLLAKKYIRTELNIVNKNNLSLCKYLDLVKINLQDNLITRFFSNKLIIDNFEFNFNVELNPKIKINYTINNEDYNLAIKNLNKIKVFILEKFNGIDLVNFINTKIYFKYFHLNKSIKTNFYLSKSEKNKIKEINLYDDKIYQHFSTIVK
jgi:hypothetical protein